MKSGFFALIFVVIFSALPVSAFELKNSERDERALRLEIETIPTPAQQRFDKYVDELAAAGQSDARPEEKARKDQADKNRQLKVVNPIVLFRW